MSSLLETTSLPEVCELVTDGTHDSPKLQSYGVPFIKGKHISSGKIDFENCDYIKEEDHQRCVKRVKPQFNDVLFSNIGSIGDAARVVTETEFSIKNVALFRPNPAKIDPLYFYYLVISPYFRGRFLNVRSGSAQPFISLESFRSLKFKCLRDKKAQENAGTILSAYDDLIENNRRRIQLLEQAARLLYKEWFVHLRFPGHEHTLIINGVPDGWEKKPLREIADITMGQSPKSIYYNNDGNGLPFHQGVTNFGVRFPTHETYCTVQSRIAELGDILFSVRAPVGRINITPNKIVIGRGLAAIRSICDQQNYLFYALKTHFFKEDMIGGGAIFAAITKKDLYGVELIQPTDRIVTMFMEHVFPVDLQIANLHQTIERLTKARDILLPKLMNGEVAV